MSQDAYQRLRNEQRKVDEIIDDFCQRIGYGTKFSTDEQRNVAGQVIALIIEDVTMSGDNKTDLVECLVRAGANVNYYDGEYLPLLTLAANKNLEGVYNVLESVPGEPKATWTGAELVKRDDRQMYEGGLRIENVLKRVRRPEVQMSIIDWYDTVGRKYGYDVLRNVTGIRIDGEMPLAKEIVDRTRIIINAKNPTVLKYYLDLGADVNVKDEYENFLLMEATLYGNLDTVKELIKNKADVNAKDRYGMTPLLEAIYVNNLDIVKKLIENKADVNARNNYGNTPLIKAVSHGNLDIIKELISAGANVNDKDRSGKTALMVAVDYGRTDIVRELIRAGDADVNIPNRFGNTALTLAVIGNQLGIVRELVSAGANVKIKNDRNENPLDIAKKSGNAELIQILKGKRI